MRQKVRISVGGVAGFLLLFVANGAAWWYWRSYLSMLLAAGMLLMLIGSLLIWQFYGRSLGYSVNIPAQTVGKNAPFSFSVEMTNASRFCSFPVQLVYSVQNVFADSREVRKITSRAYPGTSCLAGGSLCSAYCGLLKVQAESCRVYDFLHLCFVLAEPAHDGQVIVMPMSQGRDYRTLHELIEQFPEEDLSKKRGTDYTTDYEIREYQPGDELKNIHWKLTAKQNKLMTREWRTSGSRKVNVLLEFENSKAVNDARMELLREIGEALIREQYPVQLFWWSSAESGMRTRFLLEQGELERTMGEILGMCALTETSALKQQFAIEYPGEDYVLIHATAKYMEQ